MTNQPAQARSYFHASAADWQNKASGAAGYSVIEGRHGAVLNVLKRMPQARRFLDVGCGTGQLAIEVAARGLMSEGCDFAEAMIEQCRVNASAAKSSAVFELGSFFDLKYDDGAYDLISAQGFIEYISLSDMEEFFRRVLRMLRPGGALVVGSRNRLFNAVSMNDYTRIEMDLGALPALFAEALDFATARMDGLEVVRTHERVDPQPDVHPITGIGVDTRYQFSPADLGGRLRRAGLTPAGIYPVHFHGLHPLVKAERPELHEQFAGAVDAAAVYDLKLLPFCSTFVMEARRT